MLHSSAPSAIAERGDGIVEASVEWRERSSQRDGAVLGCSAKLYYRSTLGSW